MLKEIIKSYPYTDYMDDENVTAFFMAYNKLAQEIYDWMVNSRLPVFIGVFNAGDQLKWIAYGIYGQTPPSMVTSKRLVYGPYNTITFNQLAYNVRQRVTKNSQVTTSDDVFKRIMTWNFYKGDGVTFSIPWLKRRVRRFLEGVDGTDINNDQQYGVSVALDGSGGINIILSQSAQTDGYIDLSFAVVFKSAFDNNLLHMPFWAKVKVTVG